MMTLSAITAKAKLDAMRRARFVTGGGPAPPPLTSAEEAMANTLEGRPGVNGIAGGMDTDGKHLYENGKTVFFPEHYYLNIVQ